MKIGLEAWASRNFSPAPGLNTLRAWAASGRISPAPVKICKRWMVDENAVYCEQPDSIPANVSSRVAGILRAA